MGPVISEGRPLVKLGKADPEVGVQGPWDTQVEMPVGGAADRPRGDRVLDLGVEVCLITSFYPKSSSEEEFLNKVRPRGTKNNIQRQRPHGSGSHVNCPRLLSHEFCSEERAPSGPWHQHHARTRSARLHTQPLAAETGRDTRLNCFLIHLLTSLKAMATAYKQGVRSSR